MKSFVVWSLSQIFIRFGDERHGELLNDRKIVGVHVRWAEKRKEAGVTSSEYQIPISIRLTTLESDRDSQRTFQTPPKATLLLLVSNISSSFRFFSTLTIVRSTVWTINNSDDLLLLIDSKLFEKKEAYRSRVYFNQMIELL